MKFYVDVYHRNLLTPDKGIDITPARLDTLIRLF